MSSLSTLFGDKYNRDPRVLPLSHSQYGAGQSYRTSSLSLAGTSAFWFTLTESGARTTVDAADTFYTICDITGRGFLLNLVSTAWYNTETVTFRITVDGVVYTIAKTCTESASDGYRLIMGGFVVTPWNTTVVNGNLGTSNQGAMTPAVTGVLKIKEYTIIHPALAFQEGFPSVRFDYGLKVESKSSVLQATSWPRNTGALYILT